MIMNKNIAPNAGIDLSKLAGAGANAEEFWVAKATSAAYAVLQNRIHTSKLFTTLDEAVGACTANRGDVIHVAPGHSETVTSAGVIDLDVAGITVEGQGIGSDMPLLDYTVASGTVIIGAANVTLKNIHFKANITTVAKGIDIEAAGDDFVIENCRFTVNSGTVDEFASAINIASGADRGVIKGCYFNMGLAAAVQGIHLDGACDSLLLKANTVLGDYSTANIAGSTTTSTKVVIEKNLLVNGETGALNTEPNIELVANSTGIILDNDCVCNVASGDNAIVADKCMLFRNYYNETVSTATGTVIRA